MLVHAMRSELHDRPIAELAVTGKELQPGSTVGEARRLLVETRPDTGLLGPTPAVHDGAVRQTTRREEPRVGRLHGLELVQQDHDAGARLEARQQRADAQASVHPAVVAAEVGLPVAAHVGKQEHMYARQFPNIQSPAPLSPTSRASERLPVE